VDAVDHKILRILQRDATATVAEIGKAVGLSATPCWKRIQKLELSGVIRKRVAILSADKVGLGVAVYVNIQTGDHSKETIDTFIKSICAMPEVLEFHRLAGDVDFSLRVVVADVRQYEAFHQRLTALMPLRRVSSYFELQELKSETALPLGLVPETAERADAPAPLPPLRRIDGRAAE
jgi:Lrp/AsnC family transcriptional regulator